MGALIVVSGPSGVGKNTVLTKVLRHLPELVVGTTWTTRARRVGDENGIKDYRYKTIEEFRDAIAAGKFLEWAEYPLGSDQYYGTIKPPGGQATLLEIEVQGATDVHHTRPEAILIGLLPPDGKNLEVMLAVCGQRLRRRDTEDSAGIKSRLATAQVEITAISQRWPYVLINNDAERAAEELIGLVRQELASNSK